jgi:hypothetical protein
VTDLATKIDALITSAEHRGQRAALLDVLRAIEAAQKAGHDSIGIVQAVLLHVQSRMQRFQLEAPAGAGETIR